MKKRLLDLNNIEYMILIYGFPLSIWLMTLIEGISALSKLAGALVILMVIIGNEILIKNIIKHEKTKKKYKKRNFIEDLNVNLNFLIDPILLINFIISVSVGGLLGYTFLSPHILSFVVASILLFIILIGVEMLIFGNIKLHLVKYVLTANMHSIKNFFYTKIYSNWLDYIIVLMGVSLTCKFVSNTIEHIILSIICFYIIGFGIRSFFMND